MSTYTSWDEIENAIMNCRKCDLHKTRKNPVPGEGSKSAKIMFVGEAPGAVEDETGRPFVGPAGRLLTETMERLGLRRSEVYITNVLKCRPPENRDPREDEIEKCSPYLEAQIRLLKPRVVVALGRYAASWFLRRLGYEFSSILRNRGKVFRGVVCGIELSIVPTVHPAAALYNPRLRPYLESDIKLAIEELESVHRPGGRFRPKTLLDFISRGSSSV